MLFVGPIVLLVDPHLVLFSLILNLIGGLFTDVDESYAVVNDEVAAKDLVLV